MRSAIRQRFVQMFGLDLRSLALFRVCIATVILTDLALRARDLTAHYTDKGVLPTAYFLVDRSRWSLHAASGGVGFQTFMFTLAAVFAGCLLVGYRTRLATCASWLLLVSLQGRNWMILDSGDGVLAMMMFWSMFLPLGARCSADRILSPPKEPSENLFVSVATVAFLSQLCMVYWFTVVRRTDPDWWNGQVLYYVLNYERLVSSWGIWLRDLSWPLPVLSYAAIWWEVVGPVLLWVPIQTQSFRLAAIIGFVLFHLGIGIFMTIGLFPIICIVAWLAVLPDFFWEMAKQGSAKLRFFTALRSEPKLEEFIAHRVPPFLKPQPMNLRPSRRGQIVVAFFLCYVLAWNVRALDPKRFSFPAQLNFVAYFCYLGQKWSMFTPGPPRLDSWNVIPATLTNGQEIDLMTWGRPVSWTKPRLVSQQFPNGRWQKYYENLIQATDQRFQNFFASHAFRSWNRTHGFDEQIEAFTFYVMFEKTFPDRIGEPQKYKLMSYRPSDR